MGDFASWDKSSSMPLSEEEVFVRPSASSIRGAWKDLFSDPLLSLSRLKAAAISKAGLGESDPDGGIILRSVYWRFYHGLLPPPTSLDLFPPSLSSARHNYQLLRERYLIAPDGRWADDCTGSEEYHAPSPHAGPSRSNGRTAGYTVTNASQNNGKTTYDPLSLDEDSPWKIWYAHLEVRRVIMQDVDRTFPDIPYFTLDRVKRCMVTMLFLFTLLNPDVGYRQGMHELLAVCLLTVDRDSLSPSSPPETGVMAEAMESTLDRRYVEHDAFDLFMAIMKPAKAFYEWKQEEGPRRSQVTQAPIIIRCNNLHSSLLSRIDPQLWEKLETEGVEAQLWAMRWYKLIFTRELPFSLAMKMWDGIFAEDPGLGILDFICVAMVLLIRNELLDSDHSGLLTNLLRYPAPSPSYPFSPFLILSQAVLLRNSITPTTGVEVVIQNHEILGVKAQPPSRDVEPTKPLNRPPPRKAQGLAAGLFERAQAAGLDKAFLSTVADIRRNIPDSAYSYLPNLPFSPSATTRDSSGQFSSIPSTPTISRPPPPQTQQSSTRALPPPLTTTSSTDTIASAKSLVEAERQLAELRLAMVGMGKAMSNILERLSSDVDRNAREGLEKIKETLLSAGENDVEEIVKQWGWHEGLESAASSRATTPAPPLEEDSSAVPLSSEIRPVGGIRPALPESTDMTGLPHRVRAETRPERETVKADVDSTPTQPATATLPTLHVPSPRLSLATRLSNTTSRPRTPISALPTTSIQPGQSFPSPRISSTRTSPRKSMESPRSEDLVSSSSASTSALVIDPEGRGKLDKEFAGSFDPLAGLGISANPGKQAQAHRGGVARSGSGVDPLGVGLR